MARWRLSRLAEADITSILSISEASWGDDGRRRYATLLMAAMRLVAVDSAGPTTRDRADLRAGIRSLHLRHVRAVSPHEAVRRPVHVLYFRVSQRGSIEIVRVLHERMEPTRHIGQEPQ